MDDMKSRYIFIIPYITKQDHTDSDAANFRQYLWEDNLSVKNLI